MAYVVINRRGIRYEQATLRDAYLAAQRMRNRHSGSISNVRYDIREYDPATETVGPLVIRVTTWGASDAEGNPFDLNSLIRE
jgi:hypothetical protein